MTSLHVYAHRYAEWQKLGELLTKQGKKHGNFSQKATDGIYSLSNFRQAYN